MRYFFGAIWLASLLAAGSASAHQTSGQKWWSNRSLDGHRYHHYVVPGTFFPVPVTPDPNDPYGVGRAAVCCL